MFHKPSPSNLSIFHAYFRKIRKTHIIITLYHIRKYCFSYHKIVNTNAEAWQTQHTCDKLTCTVPQQTNT